MVLRSMPATRVLTIDREQPDAGVLREAAAVLRAGELVAFATETVYGLGADATNAEAVQRIFAAKGRPSDNPLIVHVADEAMARRHAQRWPETARRLAGLWPGPLTLVVPRGDTLAAEVSAGLPTVGLRVPAPAVARGLIAATGRPLAAPSANRSEHVSPTTAQHVLADLDGRIALVLDSGPTGVGIESTVVDLVSDPPRILRPGPIGADEIARVSAQEIEEGPPVAGPAHSPGQGARHYAPATPALRVESLAELEALRPTPEDVVLVVGHGAARAPRVALEEPTLAARRLYAVLRECDASGPRRILVVMPPREPAWRAIRDRLMRATRPASPGRSDDSPV